AAVQYLADLVSAHLAPDGEDAVEDPTLCRTLFLQGKLGLLQTGTYDLHTLAEEIDGAFEWGVHPVVAGPEGPRPLVHSIAALGVDPQDEEREKAIAELLSWLGGAEGQRPLAENRLGRSEEHTSELQSRFEIVCRLLLEKKKGDKCVTLRLK